MESESAVSTEKRNRWQPATRPAEEKKIKEKTPETGKRRAAQLKTGEEGNNHPLCIFATPKVY